MKTIVIKLNDYSLIADDSQLFIELELDEYEISQLLNEIGKENIIKHISEISLSENDVYQLISELRKNDML